MSNEPPKRKFSLSAAAIAAVGMPLGYAAVLGRNQLNAITQAVDPRTYFQTLTSSLAPALGQYSRIYNALNPRADPHAGMGGGNVDLTPVVLKLEDLRGQIAGLLTYQPRLIDGANRTTTAIGHLGTDIKGLLSSVSQQNKQITSEPPQVVALLEDLRARMMDTSRQAEEIIGIRKFLEEFSDLSLKKAGDTQTAIEELRAANRENGAYDGLQAARTSKPIITSTFLGNKVGAKGADGSSSEEDASKDENGNEIMGLVGGLFAGPFITKFLDKFKGIFTGFLGGFGRLFGGAARLLGGRGLGAAVGLAAGGGLLGKMLSGGAPEGVVGAAGEAAEAVLERGGGGVAQTAARGAVGAAGAVSGAGLALGATTGMGRFMAGITPRIELGVAGKLAASGWARTIGRLIPGIGIAVGLAENAGPLLKDLEEGNLPAAGARAVAIGSSFFGFTGALVGAGAQMGAHALEENFDPTASQASRPISTEQAERLVRPQTRRNAMISRSEPQRKTGEAANASSPVTSVVNNNVVNNNTTSGKSDGPRSAPGKSIAELSFDHFAYAIA